MCNINLKCLWCDATTPDALTIVETVRLAADAGWSTDTKALLCPDCRNPDVPAQFVPDADK